MTGRSVGRSGWRRHPLVKTSILQPSRYRDNVYAEKMEDYFKIRTANCRGAQAKKFLDHTMAACQGAGKETRRRGLLRHLDQMGVAGRTGERTRIEAQPASRRRGQWTQRADRGPETLLSW